MRIHNLEQEVRRYLRINNSAAGLFKMLINKYNEDDQIKIMSLKMFARFPQGLTPGIEVNKIR